MKHARPRSRAAAAQAIAAARSRPAAPFKSRVLTRAVILVIVGVATYANGLSGPFIFDDVNAIVRNERIRTVLSTSAWSPPPETPVTGRPLVNFSFALNYAVGGLDPFGYRLANLAIHILAALALFGVVRRTLERDVPDSALRSPALDVAFAAALLWLVHPLQTEVVNYVTQRTTSLKGLFFLLTLYCSVRGLPAASRRWRVLAVMACAAGMMCKETMVVAPVVVMLYDRVFVYGSFAQAFGRRWRLYAGLCASWLLLAGLVATSARTTAGFGSGVSVTTYLLNQAPIVAHYLKLVVWPRGLVLDFGVPAQYTLADVVAPALFVLSLLALTVIALRWRPRVGFLLAVVFITLAPTSSILPIATEVGALRRMSLPLAALTVLAVCTTYHVAAARRVAKVTMAPALAALCALLVSATIVRNGEFRSYLSLARLDVERRPHGRGHMAFGTQLLLAGRRSEAIAQFHLAKAANATGASFALGTEFLIDGDLDGGVRELTRFLRRHGDHASAIGAHQMLMRTYISQGKLDEAAHEAAQILGAYPRDLQANEVRGKILLGWGRAAEAIPHLQVVAAARGDDVDAHGQLGGALAMTGRFAEAVQAFDRVLSLQPGHSTALEMRHRAERELARSR